MPSSGMNHLNLDECRIKIRHQLGIIYGSKARHEFLYDVFKEDFEYADSIQKSYSEDLKKSKDLQKLQLICQNLRSSIHKIFQYIEVIDTEKNLMQTIFTVENDEQFIKRSDK